METINDLDHSDITARAERFSRVLPLAFITYSLAYLDRQNIQFGAAQGMKESLHFSNQQFALFNSFFFVGYVLFQIPGTSYAAHRSCRKLIFLSLVLWGILATLTGFLRGYWLQATDRILLGCVEGAVFPSLLVFLTHWFTKRERSRANVLLILGNPLTMFWASGASGLILNAFIRHPIAGYEPWQLMFMAEGIPTILWAIIWWIAAKDYPQDAVWLDPRKAQALNEVLEDEQKSIPHVRNYRAAFANPRLWILSALFLSWSMSIYGLNSWLAVVVKQASGLSIVSTGYLNMIPYACAAPVMLGISYWSDRTLRRKPFVWPFMFLGAAAFLGSYAVGAHHFGFAFLGLVLAAVCMYAPYGPFWALVPEMVSRNVAGESMALINTMGAVGGFLGTYVVGILNYATKDPAAGFISMGIALFLAGLLTLVLRVRENVVVAPIVDEPDAAVNR